MKKLISIFIYFSIFTLNAQITFNSLPLEKQLVARDLQTNLGVVSISGEVNLGDNYNLEYILGDQENQITNLHQKMLLK